MIIFLLKGMVFEIDGEGEGAIEWLAGSLC